jgi:hypothetical protein
MTVSDPDLAASILSPNLREQLKYRFDFGLGPILLWKVEIRYPIPVEDVVVIPKQC